MMTRIQATKSFPREIHNSQSTTGVFANPGHPGTTPLSKTSSVQSPIPPFRDLYEVSSISKVPTPNMKHQQQIVHDLYKYL